MLVSLYKAHRENDMWSWKRKLGWSLYKPKIANKPQKLGEGQRTESPSYPSERTNSSNSLISDYWPLELWDNKFLLFEPLSLCCYGSLRPRVKLALNTELPAVSPFQSCMFLPSLKQKMCFTQPLLPSSLLPNESPCQSHLTGKSWVTCLCVYRRHCER